MSDTDNKTLFYNRFAKGFYISLISLNYPVTLSVLSLNGSINERIENIEAYFNFGYINPLWTEHPIILLICKVLLLPTLISLATFYIANLGNQWFKRIELYFELRELLHEKSLISIFNSLTQVGRASIQMHSLLTNAKPALESDVHIDSIKKSLIKQGINLGQANAVRNSVSEIKHYYESENFKTFEEHHNQIFKEPVYLFRNRIFKRFQRVNNKIEELKNKMKTKKPKS